MHVDPRCRVQLVASEPLVVDPIAFDWGLDGSLYVVEMRDYPNGVPEGPLGRIKRLLDDDRDGIYDRAEVFLEDLPFPTGLKVWRDGLLVLCPPELLFVQDQDKDGKAERREVWFRGFAPGNPQHRANGLRWGLDGWLYIANGDSGGTIESVKTGERLSISGRDLRIQPDTGRMETVAGQTQYGRCRDDWDNWFGGNNSNPLWHYVLPEQYMRRNPHWPAPNPRHDVPEIPGAAPVYPRSFTLERFNDFHMANRFTSACSPEIYRDRVLGDTFAGNAFVCEPVHNLVHRLVLEPQGVTFRGRRAAEEQQSEFLASEDNWFRPVMVRTGPDGALWIADMYRLVIEHPEWIPQAWQQKLDLRAGDQMGRIWRVVPRDGTAGAVPRLDGLTIEQWVALLDQDNGPLRDMAQQLLLWHNAVSMREALEQLVRRSSRPATRAQALATLDGLDILSIPLLEAALEDPHPQVRRIALRIAGRRLPSSQSLVSALERLAGSETDPAVLFELICVLGEVPGPVPLWSLAERAPQDRFFQAAFASSLRSENIEAIVEQMLAATRVRNEWPAMALAAPVVRFLAATNNTDRLVQVLECWVQGRADSPVLVTKRLELLEVLFRYWPAAAGQDRPEVQRWTRSVLEEAQQLVLSDTSGVELKALAARLLAASAWDRKQAISLLMAMLSPRQPQQVQAAAIESLSRFSDPQVADQMLEGWHSYSPATRSRVLDAILARPDWTMRLLEALQQEQIGVRDLDAARRRQLLSHANEMIRTQAEKLLAATVPWRPAEGGGTIRSGENATV
ncbi:MAG: cytochrome c [Pirellulaceae bacterium]|nr:MAG: cytochrome c [Pirellulaceae bacterium]